MAIDSAAKRASVAGVNGPYMLGIRPDVAQPQGWRQASGWGYFGNNVGAPIPPDAVSGGGVQLYHYGKRVGFLR